MGHHSFHCPELLGQSNGVSDYKWGISSIINLRRTWNFDLLTGCCWGNISSLLLNNEQLGNRAVVFPEVPWRYCVLCHFRLLFFIYFLLQLLCLFSWFNPRTPVYFLQICFETGSKFRDRQYFEQILKRNSLNFWIHSQGNFLSTKRHILSLQPFLSSQDKTFRMLG